MNRKFEKFLAYSLWWGILAFGLCVGLYGCKELFLHMEQTLEDPKYYISPKKAAMKSFFGSGKKELFSMNQFVSDVKESNASGSFFVMVGEYSSQENQSVRKEITFYWKSKWDGVVMYNIPSEQARFKFNDSITEPYVTFDIDYSNYYKCKKQNGYKDCVDVVYFHINSSHIYNQKLKFNLHPEEQR